jgi:hypothetical protein
MKEILKIFFKYLIILILLFILIFLSVMIFHLSPLIRISVISNNNFINLIKQLLVPCFYFSLYNSLIISIFLFGVLILNYQKQHRFFTFLIPLVISCLIIFSILFFLKPNYRQLNFNNINDARVFLTSKTFFENIKNKYYFNIVNKDSVDNAIIIDDKNIKLYKNLNITFLDDMMLLNIPNNESTGKIPFPKQQLFHYYVQQSVFTEIFFKNFDSIPHRLLEQKNILLNL